MSDQPAPSRPPDEPLAAPREDPMVIHGPRLRERLQGPGKGKWQLVGSPCASPEATIPE